MPFSAEHFVTNVSWEAFDELKKPELMALAQYLELQVQHAMRKQVIKNILIDRLVDDDLLDEFYLEEKVDLQDESDSAVKLKQLEIQKEMEMAKLQLEQDRLVMEKEIKLKQIEARVQMEKDKLEKQGSSGASTHSGFDATKNIRLVPKFEEKEVDKYFLHFEKIAESLKWPKESWTLLLQSVRKLEKFILPYQLNNVKIMMRLRKQF